MISAANSTMVGENDENLGSQIPKNTMKRYTTLTRFSGVNISALARNFPKFTVFSRISLAKIKSPDFSMFYRAVRNMNL